MENRRKCLWEMQIESIKGRSQGGRGVRETHLFYKKKTRGVWHFPKSCVSRARGPLAKATGGLAFHLLLSTSGARTDPPQQPGAERLGLILEFTIEM